MRAVSAVRISEYRSPRPRHTATISSQIAGSDGLTKAGAGTLVLSGANTYNGITTLSAGTLRATTSASALGAGTLTGL